MSERPEPDVAAYRDGDIGLTFYERDSRGAFREWESHEFYLTRAEAERLIAEMQKALQPEGAKDAATD